MAKTMKVTGKTLKKMGYKPGKWFKEALLHANAHKLEGKALKDYLGQR
jgi:tRNA-splicing ligase RtcB